MASWNPRTTIPTAANLEYVKTTYGGYNECIIGSDGPPLVIPNCTGYVHGRVMEVLGRKTDDTGLSFGDAKTYWTATSSNWERSQNPTAGDVLVYSGGGGNHGHVCFVESVIDNDTIMVSESNWGADDVHYMRFSYFKCYRAYGWRPESGWNITPLGFLKNPFITPGPTPGHKKNLLLLFFAKRKEQQKKGGVIIS